MRRRTGLGCLVDTYALRPDGPEGDCGVKIVFLATCLATPGHKPFFTVMKPRPELTTFSHVYNAVIAGGQRLLHFDAWTEYLILPEVFEREVCRGFHHISIARELERLGHLQRGTEKGYLTTRETLPELSRTRVYLVAAEPIFAKSTDPID